MTQRLRDAMKTRYQLRLREDGSFRTLFTSDYHAPRGRRWDPELKKDIHTLLDVCDPDLFFIIGDLTDSGGLDSVEMLEEYVSDITEEIEKRQIAWAHVPGNHDGATEEGLPLSVFQAHPHCLSERGPAEVSGYGTYMLPVWPHDGHTEDGPAFVIWAMDAHSGCNRYGMDFQSPAPLVLPNMPVRFNGSDSVHFNQVAWYWDLSVELEKEYGRKIPGIIVMHSPVQEFCLVGMNPTDTEMDGIMLESPGPGAVNTGLFAAAYERGDVKTIVSGHDHLNNYSGKYMGILLTEDGSLGRDGYGIDEIRGGRLFTYSAEKPDEIPSRHVVVRDYREGAR